MPDLHLTSEDLFVGPGPGVPVSVLNLLSEFEGNMPVS